MANISIFAKEAFLNTNPHEPFRLRTKPVTSGHLQRVSSIIRGNQIAEKIGAKFNPTKGYKNDICIYVKPMVRKGEDFNFEGKPYLDIIDGHNLGQLAQKHPEVTVITCSQADYKIMKDAISNKIVNIPQHHCNFERIKRNKTDIKVVGVIGTKNAFDFLPFGLEKALKNRGIQLVNYSKFYTREDIINFYLSIDIQIVWRPYKKILSNPLKIVNAASFGVPTIALEEPTFNELKDYYFSVHDLDSLLYIVDELRATYEFYEMISERCAKKAEEYHIDKIAKMYKELK